MNSKDVFLGYMSTPTKVIGYLALAMFVAVSASSIFAGNFGMVLVAAALAAVGFLGLTALAAMFAATATALDKCSK